MTGMMFTYGKKKEKKRTKGSQSKKHSCHSCYFHIQAYTVRSWNEIWVFTNSKKLVEYQNLSSQFGIRFKGTFLRMALVFLFFTVNVLNFIWIFFYVHQVSCCYFWTSHPHCLSHPTFLPVRHHVIPEPKACIELLSLDPLQGQATQTHTHRHTHWSQERKQNNARRDIPTAAWVTDSFSVI